MLNFVVEIFFDGDSKLLVGVVFLDCDGLEVI